LSQVRLIGLMVLRKYSYVLELRPGAGTSDYDFGFVLLEERMPLVAIETYVRIITK